MANHELKKNVFGFSETAINFLSSYDWSGNIRELRNLIRRAVLLAEEMIEEGHLVSNAREEETNGSLDSCLENGFVKGLHCRDKQMIRKWPSLFLSQKQENVSFGIDY
jgi:transcriptional regulator with PAS, ATPase and Fis domain